MSPASEPTSGARQAEMDDADDSSGAGVGAAEIRGNVDRLLVAANQLAATIAATEAITQRRADILTEPQVVKRHVTSVPGKRDRIVSLSEAAQRTGRHPEVLRRWCSEGRIPAMRVGRTWVIGTDTLAELVAHSARSRPRLTSSRSA